VEFDTKVLGIIKRTGDIMSFRFKANLDYAPGQFFFVTIEGMTKHFSFSSSPTEKGYIEFTKRLTDSEYSQGLRRLKVGDPAHIKGPFGNFVLGDERKIAILSGGIGITPFKSMLKYIVDTDSDKDVVLLYSNRNADNIPFKDELDRFGKKENIKVFHTLTEDPSWMGLKGRIDEGMVKKTTPDWKQRTFYIAGPPKMVEALEGVLKDMGVGKIKTKNFSGY
jgi:ferredoxin-NADP reductase